MFIKRIIIASLFFTYTIFAMQGSEDYPKHIRSYLATCDEFIDTTQAQIQLCVEGIGKEKKNPQNDSEDRISRLTLEKENFEEGLKNIVQRRQEVIQKYEQDKKEKIVRQQERAAERKRVTEGERKLAQEQRKNEEEYQQKTKEIEEERVRKNAKIDRELQESPKAIENNKNNTLRMIECLTGIAAILVIIAVPLYKYFYAR